MIRPIINKPYFLTVTITKPVVAVFTRHQRKSNYRPTVRSGMEENKCRDERSNKQTQDSNYLDLQDVPAKTFMERE